MRDASLPPDWRIKAAQSALPYVHVKPERSPATDLEATATQIEGESDSDPLSEAIRAFRRGDYDGAGSRGPRAAQKAKCINDVVVAATPGPSYSLQRAGTTQSVCHGSYLPMSEAIAAVVFDLDGVLVDSESVWDAARREVVARNGGRWRADATRAMMGMSSPEWSRNLHDQLGVPLKPERINELVVAALLDQYRRRLPLLPGAVAAVRRLADRWPLGLASSANRPVIDLVLEQAGITDCFAITISGEEVTAGKPARRAPAGCRPGRRCSRGGLDERPAGGRRGGNGRDRQSQPRVPTRA